VIRKVKMSPAAKVQLPKLLMELVVQVVEVVPMCVPVLQAVAPLYMASCTSSLLLVALVTQPYIETGLEAATAAKSLGTW
jgi:hypothetical protein